MANVTFSHVVKRFGEVEALRDFDLEVEDREFLVLVGPSGSGKSTALRLLAGLEETTEGDIYIDERRVNNLPAKDRDIAMVFQSYALYPHMTVYDNMAFSLSLRHVPKKEIDRRVREAAQILHIEQLLGRRPRQLSGGQRQRVALGRAIVREPAVFLFDEPLSNLDAKLRVQMRAELTKLHQRLGTTFVYVTHDQVEAMTMASRVAVMSNAEIQQVGSPQDLYENPGNLFVAGFIGSPAMNLFRVRLEGDPEDMVVNGESFQARVPVNKALRLVPYLNREVVLGIRPEHIHDAAFLPPLLDTSKITATVEVLELMGNETLLYLSSGEHQFVARVDPRTQARMGHKLEVALDMSRMHAFDPVAEAAVV